MSETEVAILLTERTRFGEESGRWTHAEPLRLHARDDDEPDPHPDDDNDAMASVAAKFGWDAEMVAFLRDAHQRFMALSDRTPNPTTPTDESEAT